VTARTRWILAFTATVMAAAIIVGHSRSVPPQHPTQERTETLHEDWLAVYLQGQRVGYAHSLTTRRERGDKVTFVTDLYHHLELRRGATEIKVSISDRTVEDRGGRLISFQHVLEQGGAAQTTKGKVKGGKLVLTTSSGGLAQTQTVDVPEGFCPWAASEIGRARGYKPGTAYSVPIFMAQAPTKPATYDVKILPAEPVEVFEVIKWLHRVEATLSIMPNAKTVQWVDDEGTTWLGRTKFGLFTIELRKVPKEVALQPADGAEVMVAAAIEPDRQIPNPRTLDALEVEMTPAAKDVKLDLPSGPLQQVTRRGEALHLKLRRAEADPAKSYLLPYMSKEHAGLLKATPWLETNEDVIRTMSREAVGGEADALKAARKIETYVRAIIEQKTLGMGFATAAETARQKAGDCTEHAMLAAALARSAGMPSRVVLGLAYAEPGTMTPGGKFYYHMWAEVWVGQWYPLDAALGAHDATHIAIARSDLQEQGDALELSAAALQFIGAVHLRVIKIGP